MGLKKYISKRNLRDSPEPKAYRAKKKHETLRFVVQKHAASHLHYDFRLELDGLLKSWAIPKGPSLNPQDKRLAIQVEDHPYDYRNFEGIIPRGYGAGTVMVWDHGNYEVVGTDTKHSIEDRVRAGIKKGALTMILYGTKLRGTFTLVRFKNEESHWLLIKAKDAYSSEKDITKKNRSVLSNKTIEEIAETHEKKRKKVTK